MLDVYGQCASGAAGAIFWMVAVYGVQISLTAARGDLAWTASRQSVLGLIGFVACCVLLGAATPLVVDAQTVKEGSPKVSAGRASSASSRSRSVS
jgi:hypothetical protein